MRIIGLVNHVRLCICDLFAPAFMRMIKGGFWSYRRRVQRIHTTENMPAMYSSFLNHNCCFIGLGTQFAEPPVLPHGLHGIHISDRAVIGKGCTIMQNVTIGSNTMPDSVNPGSPIIGDNVFIGANATIIGNIRIGNNVRVGAGTCVFKNVADNQTVTGGGDAYNSA